MSSFGTARNGDCRKYRLICHFQLSTFSRGRLALCSGKHECGSYNCTYNYADASECGHMILSRLRAGYPGSASINLFSFLISLGRPVTQPSEQKLGPSEGPNGLAQLCVRIVVRSVSNMGIRTRAGGASYVLSRISVSCLHYLRVWHRC
jgi:hypothetical protein